MVGRWGRGSQPEPEPESELRSLPFSRRLAHFDGEFDRLRRERRLPTSASARLRALEPLLRRGPRRSPGPRSALAAGALLLLLLLLLLPGGLLHRAGPAARFLSFCGRALLIQLFSGHPVLQNTIVCSYWDSQDSLEKSPSVFLEKVHHHRLAHWAVQWKNCNKAAAKVIRGFYLRPYFLPAVVELAESNWLLMASQAENDGTRDTFVKVGDHDEDLLMWIAQLQGVFEVQLLPKHLCANNCTHYTLQLSPGELQYHFRCGRFSIVLPVPLLLDLLQQEIGYKTPGDGARSGSARTCSASGNLGF
ncbi:uncharacterized protein LOC144605855 isoform X3 [Rhinoraja longicauda]